MAEFKIGTSAGAMTLLESLTEPMVAPKSEYYPYARVVNKGNGGTRGVGSPYAVWTFALLTVEQRDQLKSFCTDASAVVYIRTKKNDDTYADFQATMIWSEQEPRFVGGHKANINVVFRNLVAV